MINETSYASEFYSFLTGRVSTAIGRRLQRNFKESGLNITAEQWSVLYFLWESEGLSQQEIAKLTYRDKPSVSRLISNLEKQKILIRVNSEGDKRANQIYLTALGHKLRDKCMLQAEKTISEAMKGVDKNSMAQAQQLLEIVFNNLK
ncbi:MarR family winged helix-turn-helix transcriptional regulator [Sphingobacterium lactis]|uniref:DNA-binding transcriptional regulator, MarR family n=1 Tax=Sphingobacterium lactis TaxID=797291 RepID=A0A1H6CAI1_9SPHI|nr:MarR family transcriptional regulator [Sphingobacterium lactis]SEG69984.1 DNA-binding transcriptional regulator, MarR family [Sphingobacterium lactis]